MAGSTEKRAVVMPTPKECATLLLLLIKEKNGRSSKEKNGRPSKEMTRLRLAELTLKRLWLRPRLHHDFLQETQDWLLTAGWALFYAGGTYAAVKTTAVKGWPRVSSKWMKETITKASTGTFDFTQHEAVLANVSEGTDDADEE